MARPGSLAALAALLATASALPHAGRLQRNPYSNFFDFSQPPDFKNTTISKQCVDDTISVYKNLQNFTLWAYEMWDASAKQVSGLMEGSVYQLGNFDECLTYVNEDEPHGVDRQYCLVDISIHTPYSSADGNFTDPGALYRNIFSKIRGNGDPSHYPRQVLHWALCAPAACSPVDLQQLINHSLYSSPASSHAPTYNATVHARDCQRTQNTKFHLDITTQCFIGFMAIIFVLTCVATIYHASILNKKNGCESELPRILKAYSMINNLKKLPVKEGELGLGILYGLRYFSATNIIGFHESGLKVYGPVSNAGSVENMFTKLWIVCLTHLDLLVDTFFVLSALLALANMLKKYRDRPMNVPLLIFQRYMRLIPTFAVMIMVTMTIIPRIDAGPLWSIVLTEADYCVENWWNSLLMLGNYINVDRMCMGQSWYIPCDFHFYILTIGVYFLLRNKRRKNIGVIILLLLLIISIIIPATITYVKNYPGTLQFFSDYAGTYRGSPVYQDVYVKSHTRASPYLLGLLASYYMYKNPTNVKFISKKWSVLGCIFGVMMLQVIICLGFLFYDFSHPYNAVESALYAGLHRTAWAASVILIIFCCIYGDLPVLSNFLSWNIWVVLGKLSYGAYLVHLGFQNAAMAARRQPTYVNPSNVVILAFGDSIFSLGISLVLYLLIDAPVSGLMQIVFSSTPRKPEPVNNIPIMFIPIDSSKTLSKPSTEGNIRPD